MLGCRQHLWSPFCEGPIRYWDCATNLGRMEPSGWDGGLNTRPPGCDMFVTADKPRLTPKLTSLVQDLNLTWFHDGAESFSLVARHETKKCHTKVQICGLGYLLITAVPGVYHVACAPSSAETDENLLVVAVGGGQLVSISHLQYWSIVMCALATFRCLSVQATGHESGGKNSPKCPRKRGSSRPTKGLWG